MDQIEMINNRKGFERPLERIKSGNDKCDTITTHVAKMSNGIKLVSVVDGEIRVKQPTRQGYIVAENGDGINLRYPTSNTRRGRVARGKSHTLTTQNEANVLENARIRKLTPIECERLQTLPDNYTEGVSEAQRYKMLGNGWTVEVIKHIFSFIPKTDGN